MRQPVPFGKYLLLDRISVGGMAEVFKAKSYGVEGFEKIIAIKRILPTMGEDRDFIKMFIDEAKIAGQLAHANICQIFELGRIDGSHFIAMEYIWGKDLLQIQNRLRKIKQPMPIAMACFSIAKVLEGLDYAHRKRDPLGRPLEIVHRDCSPQNVLVSYEGEVKVIDFGIAKATSRNSRTMAGVLKGKFGYMSPEQVRGLPLDRRSDIFALGTMLYECLTGDRLFQGETDFSTLEKVRNVDIRPPREVNPEIPPAVEAVILKALSKDVDERYQWCSEMLADLQAFLMSQDVVFTAKSLSGWLKDVFAPEIDRERQLLEEYKRLGRDGLFAGVPAAAAKADVVESLGEAPPVEGDPTMLGGPSFEEMEAASNASNASNAAAAEVGPAPGSPAARGAPTPRPAAADHDEDSADAFGEEAPTEIFGEINHGANPAAALPTARAATPAPLTRPPRPPPASRPPTAHDKSAAAAALPDVPSGPVASPQGMSPYQQYVQPPSAGGMSSPPTGQQAPAVSGLAPTGSQPIALGTPSLLPVPPNAPPGAQGRTLIGQSAPPGLPNYAQGYPPQYGQYPNQPPQRPSGPMQAPQGPGMPGTQPGMPPGMQGMQPGMQGMQPQGMQPGMQGMQPQGMPPGMQGMQPGMQGMQPGMQGPGMPMQHGMQQPYPGAAYPMPHNPYGPPPGGAVGAVEQSPLAKRKSSIARDVGIGVAIAALVLGGFLVVKFLILSDSPAEVSAPPPSSIATIHLAMTAGVSADLFVDDKKVATVADKLDIPVTAGLRKVKLVGPGGAGCEQEMTLAAGKTTTLECVMNVGPTSGGAGSAAGSATVPPAGAAAGSGSAVDSSATGATGSGASVGSGSAAGSAAAGSAAAASVAVATSDKLPPEEPAKPAGEKIVADKPPAEKAAVDKPSVEKPAAKIPATKAPAEKPAKASVAAPAKSAEPTEKPKAERPKSRASSADDDPLGRLQGGAKPLDKNQIAKQNEGKGFLTVTSKPAAKISVDGVDTGLTTPISGRSLPLLPGKHKVTFSVGGDKFTFAIAVKQGETVTLHKDLQ